MPSKPQPHYHHRTAQYSDLMALHHHFLVPIHSCSTPLQRTPRSDTHVRAMTTPIHTLLARDTLCKLILCMPGNQSATKRGVAAYTSTMWSNQRPLKGYPSLASANQD